MKGSGDAFANLVIRFEKPLVSYFYRFGWDRHLAEDLAQEVFLRVYRSRAEYEPKAKFRTFLFRIARNLWIDHVRARKTQGRTLSLSAPAGGEEDGDTLQARLEGVAPKPSAQMRREDIRREIEDALSFLPEDQRSVFLLCEVDGMKYDDAAEILGIPVGTVKSRMHTAVNRLRARLTRKK
ncbi:MAG: sigma-70 family RNA polymerase sigma factor [Planctomycetes bacterium]|nr:sigma-70 family RNA polymerase sigma factor [Planctomycetota bacterium]